MSTVYLSCSLHVSIVGFFLLFVKNGLVGAFAEGSAPAETMPAVAMNTPLSQCHAWLGLHNTVQRAKHTDTVYIELDGGRSAGREGAGKERGRKEGGREQRRVGGRRDEGREGGSNGMVGREGGGRREEGGREQWDGGEGGNKGREGGR